MRVLGSSRSHRGCEKEDSGPQPLPSSGPPRDGVGSTGNLSPVLEPGCVLSLAVLQGNRVTSKSPCTTEVLVRCVSSSLQHVPPPLQPKARGLIKLLHTKTQTLTRMEPQTPAILKSWRASYAPLLQHPKARVWGLSLRRRLRLRWSAPQP